MNSLVATDFRKTAQIAKKNWLYVQEADTATIPAIQGWNEGYLASNKYLYFSAANSTVSEMLKKH